MDKENIEERIERFKILAGLFLKDRISAFIKDIYNTYFFCDINSIEEDKVIVKCFAPIEKKNKLFPIYWVNILELKEYKEKN